jgi:hypothetical protein
MPITVNINPQPKQYACYQYLFDDITRFIGFGGGAGGGKSWLGCEWLLWNCYKYPGSKWFIGRKELKRLMGSTYITWIKMRSFHKIPRTDWVLNSKYNYIEFVTGAAKGSRIDLLDVDFKPSDPMFERFGSLEYTGGWGEEVGEWHFLAFDVLKSRIGRWRNLEFGLVVPKFLLTFNPTKNWLYRIFYKPWRDKSLPIGYSFTQSLFMDNKFTAEEYGKSLNEITDMVTKSRLRDGIWEYDDEDTVLISFDSIIDMFTATPEYSTDLYLTCDVARFGSDRIVYGLWRGWDLTDITTKQHQGIDQTITDLRTLMGEHRIPYSHCVVDEDGVGGGVVDHLKGIKGFVNNSSPIMTKSPLNSNELKKENYRNLKTQCSYIFADKVNNHVATISAKLKEEDREYLIEELGQIRRKITGDDSTLQLIAKEEIKENLGRSPDLSDCMMMRAYFELDKPKKFNYDPSLGFGGVNSYYPGL